MALARIQWGAAPLGVRCLLHYRPRQRACFIWEGRYAGTLARRA